MTKSCKLEFELLIEKGLVLKQEMHDDCHKHDNIQYQMLEVQLQKEKIQLYHMEIEQKCTLLLKQKEILDAGIPQEDIDKILPLM